MKTLLDRIEENIKKHRLRQMYGLSARRIGIQLCYSEAEKIKELLTNELNTEKK